MFGSHHILYPVKFADNTCWLFKVPATGTRDRFDHSAARSLRSEALTMSLLHRETTIPLPEVFSFDETCDNELNCPFILMSYIPGKPLYDCWFDKVSPKSVVEARRTRCLSQIAIAMIQLDKFSYDQGGCIMFKDPGHPAGIGPMRLVDEQAMLQRLHVDDSDNSTIYFEAGPFPSTKDFYTAHLEHRKGSERDSIFKNGALKLLRTMIDWLPEPHDGRKPFVLAHPDFDIQNFLVSEEGELQGIIDWDGAAALPRSLGNEAYPGWLTRDWDPAMYAWNEDMERGIEPKGLWEDSPATLSFYRTVYADFMASYCQSNVQPGKVTRNSLISDNLAIATSSPLCMLDIVNKMFDAISDAARRDSSIVSRAMQADLGNNDSDSLCELSFYDVCCDLIENKLSDSHRELLRAGFEAVLQNI